jgi:hypothetical protein
MNGDNPDHHIGFAIRCQVIHQKEVYRKKEDAHGGPGYYPESQVVAAFYRELAPAEVATTINKVARGEFK